MVTLSIQADEELQAALQERADLQGKTVSDLAREILREAIAQRPLGERVGHLRGRLELPSTQPTPRTEHGPGWRVNLPTFRGQGLRPGVNLDDSAALLEVMESPNDVD